MNHQFAADTPPISLAITSFNEEGRIGKCLSSAHILVSEPKVME